jgi:heavy metal translocating P-type ATPase
VIALVSFALVLNYFLPSGARQFLFVASFVGSLHVVLGAAESIIRRHITIDTFNVFALGIAFAAGEIISAAFIVFMLASADLLEWHTSRRTQNAVEELLKLKPDKAVRDSHGTLEEISVSDVHSGDILVVSPGARVPVDGIVISGDALVNESSMTGESLPVRKVTGDSVFGLTLNETGALKIRATRVGSDSTIEQMAALIREASKNKSRSEKLADKFATYFLPVVVLIGTGVYVTTHNIVMVASVFLVACADDMAVAIPLAITASLGNAARRGLVIKGGEWLDKVGKIKTIVLDKTGTLTYGSFSVRRVHIEPDVAEDIFWRNVAIVEKFSEHPIARALFRETIKYIPAVPDPEEFKVVEGGGARARYSTDDIIVGNRAYLDGLGVAVPEDGEETLGAIAYVAINKKYAGAVELADSPREEARASIAALKHLGVERIIMFTGDNETVARAVSGALGIDEYRASMKPEDKLCELEMLARDYGPVAMVGDGINDAPALARADVGIAMGAGGTAVAVEAADIVILSDDLARLPEAIMIGRRTMGVVRSDSVIWFLSNMLGFTLVLTGVIGPVLAAVYNFATDFFPLANSARLFRRAAYKQ